MLVETMYYTFEYSICQPQTERNPGSLTMHPCIHQTGKREKGGAIWRV